MLDMEEKFTFSYTAEASRNALGTIIRSVAEIRSRYSRITRELHQGFSSCVFNNDPKNPLAAIGCHFYRDYSVGGVRQDDLDEHLHNLIYASGNSDLKESTLSYIPSGYDEMRKLLKAKVPTALVLKYEPEVPHIQLRHLCPSFDRSEDSIVKCASLPVLHICAIPSKMNIGAKETCDALIRAFVGRMGISPNAKSFHRAVADAFWTGIRVSNVSRPITDSEAKMGLYLDRHFTRKPIKQIVLE